MKKVKLLFAVIKRGAWKDNNLDRHQLRLLIDLALNTAPFELLGCE